MPVILAFWEAEIERIKVPGQPRQIVHETPSPKQPEQNGGMVQAVEYLLCKHKALNLNHTPIKKKKKERI
jgi:hypothetical protein